MASRYLRPLTVRIQFEIGDPVGYGILLLSELLITERQIEVCIRIRRMGLKRSSETGTSLFHITLFLLDVRQVIPRDRHGEVLDSRRVIKLLCLFQPTHSANHIAEIEIGLRKPRLQSNSP